MLGSLQALPHDYPHFPKETEALRGQGKCLGLPSGWVTEPGLNTDTRSEQGYEFCWEPSPGRGPGSTVTRRT